MRKAKAAAEARAARQAQFKSVYGELIERHGCTSATDKALCRAVAKALLADNVDPNTIERLVALLPPKAQAQGPKAIEVHFWLYAVRS